MKPILALCAGPPAIFLLSMACAFPPRISSVPERLLSKPDLNVLLDRLKATENGRKLLDGVHVPIQVAYGTQNGLIGAHDPIRDRRGTIIGHRLLIHDNLRKLPPSHPFLAVVAAHELTHAYHAGLSTETELPGFYEEMRAYAVGMRVWLGLDTEKQPLPEGLVRDFEGNDMALVLAGIRSAYERSLEDFADMIDSRYRRFSQSLRRKQTRGGQPYTSFKNRLKAGADRDLIRGWKVLQQEDALFRSHVLPRESK